MRGWNRRCMPDDGQGLHVVFYPFAPNDRLPDLGSTGPPLTTASPLLADRLPIACPPFDFTIASRRLHGDHLAASRQRFYLALHKLLQGANASVRSGYYYPIFCDGRGGKYVCGEGCSPDYISRISVKADKYITVCPEKYFS